MIEVVLDAVVAKGAAWLDERRPGWHLEIDPATLDLSQPHRCVLGQVGRAILIEHGFTDTNTYNSSGFDALTNPWAQRNDHVTCIRTALAVQEIFVDDEEFGFNWPSVDPAVDSEGGWPDLDAAWIRAIKKRIG